jgi:hypothetical protein
MGVEGTERFCGTAELGRSRRINNRSGTAAPMRLVLALLALGFVILALALLIAMINGGIEFRAGARRR